MWNLQVFRLVHIAPLSFPAHRPSTGLSWLIARDTPDFSRSQSLVAADSTTQQTQKIFLRYSRLCIFCSISTVTFPTASRWCRMNNSKESCASVLQMFCLIESNYGSSSSGICRIKTKTEKHWKYFPFAMAQTISLWIWISHRVLMMILPNRLEFHYGAWIAIDTLGLAVVSPHHHCLYWYWYHEHWNAKSFFISSTGRWLYCPARGSGVEKAGAHASRKARAQFHDGYSADEEGESGWREKLMLASNALVSMLKSVNSWTQIT